MRILKSVLIALALVVGPGISATAQSTQAEPFTQAELDQMLAPIALYPDTVLSHVLIAATYPLEIVQAARWSRQNPSLRGERAVGAVERMDWDPSVKALVAFPELLKRLDEDLQWTQRLGDAFLMQEDQVVDAIQHLRSEAYAHGHLRSNEHVRVVRETQYIYIEPARSRVVYVPYYDPRVVYVGWRWASHPPVYWHHPPGYRSRTVFYWGPAYHVAPSFYFSSFHWSRRQVVSVHHHHHYYGPRHRHARQTPAERWFGSAAELARHESARHWQHNPRHRRGVSYRPGVSESRFVQQQSSQASTAGTRTVTMHQQRTRSQQRQWADQQRASAPIRERAQTRTQARSATSATPQRNQTIRNDRHSRSEATQTTRRPTVARASGTGTDATPRTSARESVRTQSSARNQGSTPARASTSRNQPQARSEAQTSRQVSPRRDVTVQRDTRTSSSANTPRPSVSVQRQQAPARQAQAPRTSRQTTSTSPQQSRGVTSSGQQSRSAPAPRTQATSPSRSSSTSTPARSSRGTAPRSSATRQSSTRSAATPRSSGTNRSSRRDSRQID